jgi:ubiquinone/menaquinone biosynthesis C-methylase UbiE
MTAKEFLSEKIDEELGLYYKDLKQSNPEIRQMIIERWSNDALNSENSRYQELNKYIQDLGNKKILDMSSGCGSFVIQGLLKGHNVHGIEPEDWKQALIDLKFKENSYPSEWRSNIRQGIGEKLPFENESFDVFNSWQTFEHVQSVQACLNELNRVLKPGGKGIIHCPSYMTFYEGHYRMFWLPMLGNSSLGKFYVKLMRRPIGGLSTFVPITKSMLVKQAKKAGFTITDIPKNEIYDAAKRRFPRLIKSIGFFALPILYNTWALKQAITRFGRVERTIHVMLTKENKMK